MTQMSQMTSDRRDLRTYAIIGAAQKVHRLLGAGYLERVYQEALSIELARHGIAFEQQIELAINYDGVWLNARYRADLFVEDSVLVELKAIRTLTEADDAQLLNYLKAAGIHLGLLLNFGATRLQVKRLVWGASPSVTSVTSVDGSAGATEGLTAARAAVPAPPPTPTSGTTPAPSGSTPSG